MGESAGGTGGVFKAEGGIVSRQVQDASDRQVHAQKSPAQKPGGANAHVSVHVFGLIHQVCDLIAASRRGSDHGTSSSGGTDLTTSSLARGGPLSVFRVVTLAPDCERDEARCYSYAGGSRCPRLHMWED